MPQASLRISFGVRESRSGAELMFYVGCPAPLAVELGVLVVIPVVYLTLMYLTFTSQD